MPSSTLAPTTLAPQSNAPIRRTPVGAPQAAEGALAGAARNFMSAPTQSLSRSSTPSSAAATKLKGLTAPGKSTSRGRLLSIFGSGTALGLLAGGALGAVVTALWGAQIKLAFVAFAASPAFAPALIGVAVGIAVALLAVVIVKGGVAIADARKENKANKLMQQAQLEQAQQQQATQTTVLETQNISTNTNSQTVVLQSPAPQAAPEAPAAPLLKAAAMPERKNSPQPKLAVMGRAPSISEQSAEVENTSDTASLAGSLGSFEAGSANDGKSSRRTPSDPFNNTHAVV